VLPVELRCVVRRLQRPVREAEERIRKNRLALVALEALPHRITEDINHLALGGLLLRPIREDAEQFVRLKQPEPGSVCDDRL
jgi:uncharacterized protein YeeX (DUF496 family)